MSAESMDRRNFLKTCAFTTADGFQYAFANGADFACVGMCDFQVREDAIIANKVLDNLNRARPSRA